MAAMTTSASTKSPPGVALVGAGSMGGAMLRGWIDAKSINPKTSCVFDPAISDDLKRLADQIGIAINPMQRACVADIAIIAVKPQKAGTILPAFSETLRDRVIVSVMAGSAVPTISGYLGGANKIIRAMPNLPALYRAGATGLFASNTISEQEREQVTVLMDVIGDVVWVESESEIDFVTAISGSGPAYFLLLVEALEEAGTTLGLSPEVAERLARATLSGAGAVIDNDQRSAAQLRKMVTSPGGTTEAALREFDGDKGELRELVKRAAAAAAARAKELAG